MVHESAIGFTPVTTLRGILLDAKQKRKWAHKTEILQERWHIKKRLKNYRRFIRVFECYSFNSILEYRKIGKILPKCILFFKNVILNKVL